MLKTKRGRKIVAFLALSAVCGIALPQTRAVGVSAKELEDEEKMTILKEESAEMLYLDALKDVENGAKGQKFTTVKRGDFITTATVSGTVAYPKQETFTYKFPYGTVYFLETVGGDTKVKEVGDPIANIASFIDEIELASVKRRLQRMEERGETETSAYSELKTEFEEMYEALNQTQILMEEAGVLLSQDTFRYGTQITSYEIVVADPSERLIEVSNESKNFRYGQSVQVSAKINGKTVTGTGKVVTASANSVSEELLGGMAYVRLDEGCEDLYDGASIAVTVETVHMEDVLLLEASAVYMENGVQKVKVKDAYGLHAVTFSFGRKNTAHYWIIDGLEEGTEILLQ